MAICSRLLSIASRIVLVIIESMKTRFCVALAFINAQVKSAAAQVMTRLNNAVLLAWGDELPFNPYFSGHPWHGSTLLHWWDH